MSDILGCKGLTKKFGDGDNATFALKNINIEFKRAEIVSIVGQSGSGKSTLLNLLSGLDAPSSGDVYFEGKSLNNLKAKEKSNLRLNEIGFVFQFFNLIPNLTAYDNAILPAILNGTAAKKKRKVNSLFEQIGLQGKLHLLPSQLSGGEQQRVAIIRALINDPKIIFADEPTGNLDTKNGLAVIELLLKYAQDQNHTLIYVTHDILLANKANRVVKIVDGELVEET